MPREAGRDVSFVKRHTFQLPSSRGQPLLAVLQSSPNVGEGCPPLGWSRALGYNAQPVGTFSSANASSGETVSVQAAEAKLACPSTGESMSPVERNKIHCWSLSKVSMALWMFLIPVLRPFLQGSEIFVNFALANEQGSTTMIGLEDKWWP